MDDTAQTDGGNAKNRAWKIASVILNVIIYLFFALCIIALIFSLASKRDVDGAVKLFGHEMRIVTSSSMERNDETYEQIKNYAIKDIPVKTMVFIELVPDEAEAAEKWYSELAVGDVLTIRYYVANGQETITHRISSIEKNPSGRGYEIHLLGDNRSDDDVPEQVIDTSQEDSPNYVIGKVTGANGMLGALVFSIKQPVGTVLIIIVPCAIIIVMQVIRIIGIVTEDKKKKLLEMQESRDSEIEQLKRKIAELENRRDE